MNLHEQYYDFETKMLVICFVTGDVSPVCCCFRGTGGGC